MIVVFACNRKILKHLKVTMRSVILNSRHLPINFVLLTFDDIKPEELPAQTRVIRVQQNRFYWIPDTLFQRSHITRETYLRYLIPELLPEEDQVLYLDVDLVVVRDLQELWSLLPPTKMFGMVHQTCELYEGPMPTYPGGNEYQGGVMLMNLKVMRKNQFAAKAFALLKEKLKVSGYVTWSFDQEITSQLARGFILPLKFWWNFTNYALGAPGSVLDLDDDTYLDSLIGRENREQIAVYHYAGPEKPWDRPDSRWAKYA